MASLPESDSRVMDKVCGRRFSSEIRFIRSIVRLHMHIRNHIRGTWPLAVRQKDNEQWNSSIVHAVTFCCALVPVGNNVLQFPNAFEFKLNNLSIWIKVFRVVFHVCSTWKVFDQFECENCLLFESDFWRRRSTLRVGERCGHECHWKYQFSAHINVPCLFNYLRSKASMDCSASQPAPPPARGSIPFAIEETHTYALKQTISIAHRPGSSSSVHQFHDGKWEIWQNG